MGLEPPDPTDARRERRLAVLTTVVFAAIALLAAGDVVADLSEGSALSHVLVECVVLVFGLAGVVLMGRRLRALGRRERELREQTAELTRDLETTKREAERWKREAAEVLAGLGAAIDVQFERWGLSPAEKEVALLLLKGLSHREIAAVRGVGEATTRQQARAAYKKAGVSGRHDLSAFFLEDLLLPRGE